VVENVQMILGVELMNASQAIHFRRPQKSSPILETVLEKYVKLVPFMENDEYIHPKMVKSKNFIKNELWKMIN
ncbi:MAG: histidine ammonia-lyase, partial [Crocinitomicaceae bacterium]